MLENLAIAYLDGHRLSRALSAGILHLAGHRDYINKINVFPVPDGDTGTNMVFTLNHVLDRIQVKPDQNLSVVANAIAEAAVEGARGNSGAIMAQFFCGFSEVLGKKQRCNTSEFSVACKHGADAAWRAMSDPVPGTLPTVLEDFANSLMMQSEEGERDFLRLIATGLDAARKSLANTPNLLPALQQAGVVDAAGQGFVDLLEGVEEFLRTGAIDTTLSLDDVLWHETTDSIDHEHPDHQYCTECVIRGAGLNREQIQTELTALDSSSLVVAGNEQIVRVHIHSNAPAEVFDLCESLGSVSQRKADDMFHQMAMKNYRPSVAIVTDTGADIPKEAIAKYQIGRIPMRLSFGDKEYFDRVMINPERFYDLIQTEPEHPLTSQPPVGDFSRVYQQITGLGKAVVSLQVSNRFSGSYSAALAAAKRVAEQDIAVVDTLNASVGHGLLAIAAAEAAERGESKQQIVARLEVLIPKTLSLAMVEDLRFAVRGGRLKPWVKRIANLFSINPVLKTTAQGTITLAGVQRGRGIDAGKFARRVLNFCSGGAQWRAMVAHAQRPELAATLQEALLADRRIDSCDVTEAGPALGVHVGPGGLVVGIMPEPTL